MSRVKDFKDFLIRVGFLADGRLDRVDRDIDYLDERVACWAYDCDWIGQRRHEAIHFETHHPRRPVVKDEDVA